MAQAHEHKHPGEKEYIKIAVILAVITALEVAVYYIESLRPLLVPVLLSMAFVKFVLVAGWFMHLKFDSRIFRRLFIVGIVTALGVFTILLVTLLVAFPAHS
ncbi:MAG: cytochrome C oxidase subunit IV family protein [Actinomycetota bacterium]